MRQQMYAVKRNGVVVAFFRYKVDAERYIIDARAYSVAFYTIDPQTIRFP